MQSQRRSPIFGEMSGNNSGRPTPLKYRHYCMYRCVTVLLLLIGTLVSMNGFSTALAASSQQHIVNTPTCPVSSGTFCWYGGPVQHHPKVYLIFWGSEWKQDSDHVIPAMVNLFQSLDGSNYNNILAQYYDSQGPISNDTTLASTSQGTPYYIYTTTEPPGSSSNVNMAIIGDLAYKALIAAGGNPTDFDNQVLVFPQKYTSYPTLKDTCGEHEFGDPFLSSPNNLVYGVVRYISTQDTNGDPGCPLPGTNPNTNKPYTVAETMTMVASHEYAEMATDPQADHSGWTQGSTSTEIGDLCNRSADTYTSVSGVSSVVQQLWSNASNGSGNGCITTLGIQYLSPVYPYQHTVQGLILNEYQSKGEATSPLGSPLSEETPIAGGRVSYFNSICGGTNTCAGIYWKSGESQAYTVWGVDFTKYDSLHGPNGTMGFPLSDEQPVTNPYSNISGTVQYFSELCSVPTICAGLYYSPATGSHPVWGGNYALYNNPTLKGPAGLMGFPLSDEQPVTNPYSNISGTAQYFTEECGGNSRCAAIYASPVTASHQVWGGNYALYNNTLGGPAGLMGFPITPEQPMNGGTVQYFTEKCSGNSRCAAIYASFATASHQVWGGDYVDYVRLGEANGPLAFPLTPEIPVSGGTAQYFTANHGCGTPGPDSSDGAIYANPNIGSHAVYGCIYAFYQQWGQHSSDGLSSMFGFPMSDETGITDYWGNPGRVNYFQGSYCGTTSHPGSAIYWWTGAHEVHGCIFDTYYRMNGPNSKLGFPISNEYTNSLGYRESDFSNGEIVWENGNAVVLYSTSCVTTGKCN